MEATIINEDIQNFLKRSSHLSNSQIAKIESQLRDNGSPLSIWANRTEQWAEKSFGFKKFFASDFIRQRVNSRPAAILDRVVDYIKLKEKKGLMSHSEYIAILDESMTQPGAGNNHLHIAAAYIEKLVALYPSIIDENIRQYAPDRTPIR